MPAPELSKKKRMKQRSQVGVDRQLEKNLRAYEMAGRTEKSNLSLTASVPVVAVSLCALALSQTMLGEVVCTPAHESVHGRSHLQFDLNNDGINDVGLSAYSTFRLGSSGNFFRESFLGAYGLVARNEIAANKQGFAFAGRSGQELGPSDPFFKGAIMASAVSSLNGHEAKGFWLNVKSPRFLGVKFLISRETHFGWIRILSSTADQATISGYAYETVPNKPVIAGVCKDQVTAPDAMMELAPGSLGRLAAGAAGR